MTEHNGESRHREDALRLHLLSEHRDPLALGRSDLEAVHVHLREHTGPGTIRNHPVDDYRYDPAKVAETIVESDREENWAGDQITVALTPVQALAIAAGRPHVGKTRDGRQVYVRLYTAYEWIAERAGAGDTTDYDRAVAAVTPMVVTSASRLENSGRWAPAPDCQVVHQFGEEGWRPAADGTHEHYVSGQ